MIRDHTFSDPEALAEALAAHVQQALAAALRERPTATLVVSGGSTPRPFFERFRTLDLPWDRLTITLADERWVPVDHPESNERMVRETLLQGAASQARWVGLKTTHGTVDAAAGAACHGRIAPLRPFDVVILGMGTDGHTASLFPHAPSLAAGLDLDSGQNCVAVAEEPGPGARRARISLTLPALLDSRWIVLHCTGEEKWQVYQRARTPGADSELPLRAVLREAPRGLDVYWAP